MNAKFIKGIALGAVVGGLTVVSTAAFAGSGIGSVFNLGKTNSVNGTTTLQGSTKGQQLRVVNSNTSGSATGIGIQTNPNKPPLVVNSQTKVANLDGDLLDGVDSSALQRQVTGSCAGTGITSVGASGATTCASSFLFPEHTVLANGKFVNDFLTPGIDLQLNCNAIPGFAGFNFVNTSNQTAAVNWLFSQGGTTSTVNANGQNIAPGGFLSFSLSDTRLEGQFIYSDPQHVVTLHIHVIKDATQCEFNGTALVSNV